jgi:hypothetical protein
MIGLPERFWSGHRPVHALGRHAHGIDAPEETTMSDVPAMRDPRGANAPPMC